MRLLRSADVSERVRGLERLGEVGTPAATELLARSLEPGGAAKGYEERLATVRALAKHADKQAPRQTLARAMASSVSGRADDGGETLVRDTAALALARSAHKDALEILGKALRQEGPVAASALRALSAHPPRNLRPILAARGAPTRTLIDLLDALGDQRAFSALRGFVKHGSPELKGRALVALTRLGDYETVAVARLWLKQTKNDRRLRLAAAETLLMAHAPDAGRALSALLDDPDTAEAATLLASQSRSEALLPGLAKRLSAADASSAPALLAAIGRIGTARAAQLLSAELANEEHGAAAAYALGTCASSDAGQHLARALLQPKTRRNAARASVVREVVLGDRVDDLDAALRSLIVSEVAADRAAGAWGLATKDTKLARTLLGRSDHVVVRAAARAALAVDAASVAADRLAGESDPLTRAALAIALTRESSARRVPTRVIVELLEGGGAAAAVAAKALSARDDATLRPQIELLSKSGDPLIRAHVALGLSDSRAPSSIGLLAEMYRAEQNADVRHAVIVALSRRTDSTRRATLRLAADLDGDERVRSAARLALKNVALSPLPTGRSALWLALVDSGTGPSHPAQARVGTPSGVALPVVADPDGLVVMAGLPEGPLVLRLATGSDESNAPGR